jgi:hypothetical protein
LDIQRHGRRESVCRRPAGVDRCGARTRNHHRRLEFGGGHGLCRDLPLGTTIWSNPGDGSGIYSVVPAVLSPDEVADVFAFQYDGSVQATRGDGTTAWMANLAWDPAVPDFQGRLIVRRYSEEGSSLAIAKLDGRQVSGIPRSRSAYRTTTGLSGSRSNGSLSTPVASQPGRCQMLSGHTHGNV